MWVAGQGTRWWGVHINGEQGGARMIKIRQKRNWVSFVAANWRYGSVILSDPRHVLDVLHRIGSKELDGWESESVTHLALNHFLLACHFKFWFKQWGFPLRRTASAAYLVFVLPWFHVVSCMVDGKFNVLLSKIKVLHTHFMIGHACWYYEIQIRNVTVSMVHLHQNHRHLFFINILKIPCAIIVVVLFYSTG